MQWRQSKKKRSSRVTRAQAGKMTSHKTQDPRILVVEKGTGDNSDKNSD